MRNSGLKYYLVLILICFLVYANSLNNAFVFDDVPAIVENPKISQPFNYWSEPTGLLNSFSYALGKDNLVAFHLINIILHALNTILVFLFLCLFFKINSSFIAACLFAVHPIHTEAVTWISGKSYIILSLFILAPLLLYYRSTYKKEGNRWIKVTSYMLSLLMFSYFITTHYGFYFTFPLFLLLLDLVFNSWKRNWRFWIPFLGIDILWLFFVRNAILTRISTVASITGGQVAQGTNPVINLVISVFSHLWLLVFPARLSVYHDPVWFSLPLFYLGAAVLLVFILASPVIIRKARLFFFAVIIFVLSFAPAYSPFQVASLVSERYIYFPSIVLSIFFAFLLDRYTTKARGGKKVIVISAVFILFCAYSVRTIIRNSDWRTEASFWRSTIKTSSGSPGALNGMGLVYMKEGKMGDAKSSFKKAIQVRPTYANAYNNLGNLFADEGKSDEAIELFKKAIEINPYYFEAYNNLGNVYSDMGKKLEAIALYKKVIELNPQDLDAYYNLGNVYRDIGKSDEAIFYLRKAVEINPRDIFALNNLGNMYALTGERREAEKCFREAIKIDPNYASAQSNLLLLLKNKQE